MKKSVKAMLAAFSATAMLGIMVGCNNEPATNPPTTNPSTTNPPVTTTQPTTNPPTTAPAPLSTKYGEGYGLVHGGGYVGRAVIAMDGDKIEALSWDEACLPTYVTAGEIVPEADKVTTKVMSHGSEVEKVFYKTVKFADVTMTYNLEKNTYVVGDKTMAEFFQDEANCKKYYDAVFAAKVAVVVDGKDDTTVLTPKALLKTHNGYWDTEPISGLGYRVNYEKSVAYIMKYGLKAAATLEKDGTWIDDNDVNSGATWTDFNTKKENTLSYVELVSLAASHVEEAKWAAGYGMVHGSGYIGRAFVVEDKDGNLVDISWDEACLPTYVTAGETVPEADKVTTKVVSHGSEVEKVFYKTVKFADVTMTYNLEKNTYVVGDKTMVEWFQVEANAQKYYDAVVANEVSVVVNGENNASVLTAKVLLKSRNNYWNTATVSGLGYWINYGKSIDYMLTNGLKAAQTLEKDGTWIDDNDVNSGATWTDFNTKKENTLSYVQLVVLAAGNID